MTDTTRDRSARAGHNAYFEGDLPDGVERELWLKVVDAILDELMEPGEAAHAAFEAMDKPTCHGDPKARAWDALQGYRAILTVIKEGK